MKLKNRMTIREYLYEVERLKLVIADCKFKIVCFQLGGTINEPLDKIEKDMKEAEKYLHKLQNPLSTV